MRFTSLRSAPLRFAPPRFAPERYAVRSAAELRLAEVRPAEVRPAEVCRAEVRPAEVRPAEIGMDVGVLLTPRVPGIHTLPKLSDVLVIRHVSSSTRLPTACYRLATPRPDGDTRWSSPASRGGGRDVPVVA